VAAAVDAHDLVSAARDVMRIEHEGTAGLWPRAAALLARQGLELAMRRLWEVAAPGLERTSSRCQLLCVGTLLDDRELGGRVHAAWITLSESCHHRVYELPPTAAELQRALETVWEFADAVERLRGRAQGR
jgi:hypothetical protein